MELRLLLRHYWQSIGALTIDLHWSGALLLLLSGDANAGPVRGRTRRAAGTSQGIKVLRMMLWQAVVAGGGGQWGLVVLRRRERALRRCRRRRILRVEWWLLLLAVLLLLLLLSREERRLLLLLEELSTSGHVGLRIWHRLRGGNSLCKESLMNNGIETHDCTMFPYVVSVSRPMDK